MPVAHYDASIAYDQKVKRGVPGQVARVFHPITDLPIDELLDLDGNPIAALVSNSQGFVEPFEIVDGPPHVKMSVGSLRYYIIDLNLVGSSAEAAILAAAAAERAASLVEAPADEVVKLLIEGESLSQVALLDLLALRGSTADGLIAAGEKARLFGSTPIGDTDLNALTTPGKYHQNTTSYVSSERHYPWYGTNTQIEVRPIGLESIGQYAHAPLRGDNRFRYRNAAKVWSAWSTTYSPDATPAFFGTEQRTYPTVLTNTTRFAQHTTGAPTLTRSGNFIELAGRVTVAQDGAGSNFTSVFHLPPDALPHDGTLRYYTVRGLNGKVGMLYISATGNVQIFDMPGLVVGDTIYVYASWMVAPAPPYSFERICKRMFEGTDYTRTIDANGHWLNVNAVHGGEIEQGTSEIAQAIRSATGASWYEWDIRKTSVLGSTAFDVAHEVNGDYKGVKFDDPDLVDIIIASDDCLAFHGASDGAPENGRPPGALTFLGGDNKVLRELIGAHLRAAGFPALDDPAQFPTLAGAGPRQAHNSAKNQGVQVEISTTQRKAFFVGGDTSRANRVNTTQAFADYRDAIFAALTQYRA